MTTAMDKGIAADKSLTLYGMGQTNDPAVAQRAAIAAPAAKPSFGTIASVAQQTPAGSAAYTPPPVNGLQGQVGDPNAAGLAPVAPALDASGAILPPTLQVSVPTEMPTAPTADTLQSSVDKSMSYRKDVAEQSYQAAKSRLDKQRDDSEKTFRENAARVGLTGPALEDAVIKEVHVPYLTNLADVNAAVTIESSKTAYNDYLAAGDKARADQELVFQDALKNIMAGQDVANNINVVLQQDMNNQMAVDTYTRGVEDSQIQLALALDAAERAEARGDLELAMQYSNSASALAQSRDSYAAQLEASMASYNSTQQLLATLGDLGTSAIKYGMTSNSTGTGVGTSNAAPGTVG